MRNFLIKSEITNSLPIGGGVREPFIDTAKGLCVLSIILIHTVFWSGKNYTPLYMKNLVLMFDVPVFFFLTGCLLSIKTNLDPLKQIAKIIIIFLIPVLVINLSLGYCSLKNIMLPVCLAKPDVKFLPVIGGSYWFVPVYVAGLIYSVIITKFLHKFWQIFILIAIPVYYLYSWITKSVLNINILGVPLQRELFYIWLILLGFMTFKLKNKIFWIGLILTGIAGIIVMNFNIDNLYFQEYKFVTHLPYILASLPSVGVIMLFKNKLKNNFLQYLGKRALYFYLSQGIGASLLFFIVGHIHLYWLLKLLICFGINLVISLNLGFLFCKIPEWYPAIINFSFQYFKTVVERNKN